MANLANMPMSCVHIWPHTEQQQVHKIKSKCSVFEKIDDVAQLEKIPACSKNRVSEKVLLQFICLQGFNIYPLKILLTISLVLGKK